MDAHPYVSQPGDARKSAGIFKLALRGKRNTIYTHGLTTRPMLDFLKKHGDNLVKEKPGPKKRLSSTLKLVQYVLKRK